MKVKIFIKNACVLTAASFVNMSIGILFRIYMSNKVGAEAIGLYQLISSIYFFAATFSTSGISLTVTRLVTDFIAKKEYNKINRLTKKCLLFGTVIGLACGVVLYIFSNFIGKEILKDTRVILSLKILAPALPFIAISSTYRGYFYAVRKVAYTSGEQLFEQILEIVIFMMLIGTLAPKGIEYALCAIVIGTTVSEILSCVYSYALYELDVKKYSKGENKEFRFISSIIKIFFPLTASASLRAGLSTVENVLIPSGLKKYGASSQKALSSYGVIMGMVLPVISFPNLFLLSFSMLLIPEMSEAYAIGHKAGIRCIATEVLKITSIFSVAVMGIFYFFSSEFGRVIYSSDESGMYIKILSPLVLLMYLDKVVDGMLKGLNEQLSYLFYNILDSATRVVLIFILAPILGIRGILIMMFVSTILNSLLSIRRLLKVTQVKFDFSNWLIKPLLSITFSGLFVKILMALLSLNSGILVLILEIALSLIIYLTVLLLTECVKREEICWVLKRVKC